MTKLLQRTVLSRFSLTSYGVDLGVVPELDGASKVLFRFEDITLVTSLITISTVSCLLVVTINGGSDGGPTESMTTLMPP
jgi:hypothetical protein